MIYGIVISDLRYTSYESVSKYRNDRGQFFASDPGRVNRSAHY